MRGDRHRLLVLVDTQRTRLWAELEVGRHAAGDRHPGCLLLLLGRECHLLAAAHVKVVAVGQRERVRHLVSKESRHTNTETAITHNAFR